MQECLCLHKWRPLKKGCSQASHWWWVLQELGKTDVAVQLIFNLFYTFSLVISLESTELYSLPQWHLFPLFLLESYMTKNKDLSLGNQVVLHVSFIFLLFYFILLLLLSVLKVWLLKEYVSNYTMKARDQVYSVLVIIVWTPCSIITLYM